MKRSSADPSPLWPPNELLPQKHPNTTECANPAEGKVRALLVGVDDLPALNSSYLSTSGSVNDAGLMASVLRRYQVSLTFLPSPPRAMVIDSLASLGRDSHCGDTIIFFLSGRGYALGDLGLYFLMRDAIDVTKAGTDTLFPSFSIPGSPALREGRRIPGVLDSNQLLDYFDRLRDNGVNVLFICETSGADRFAQRMRNDFATWDAPRVDLGSDGSYQASKGAYFGIYIGQDLEMKLPPGDPQGRVHTIGAWAVASALGELGNSGFSVFSEKVLAVWKQMLAQTDSTLDLHFLKSPVFESSHPYRSPLATGLPTTDGSGESRLRSVETRHIEINAPALQRGAARVGLGFVLIQGRIVSPTPPISITANGIRGEAHKDGTFQVQLPVVPGENLVSVTAWWSDTDFVPGFPFTVIAQDGDNIVQEGRRYAVLIGNQKYNDRAFPQLDTPTADANALARLLVEHFGFLTSVKVGDQTISLILDDADRQRMLKVLAQLRYVLAPGDSLLLYYGGHGIYEKVTDSAYWLPVDAAPDSPDSWISGAEITAALARLHARHILVVADSCYSGGFRSRGGEQKRDAMSRVQFLDGVNLRPSRNFISSGANEPVADGGGNGHSVFARALIDGLAKEKAPFTAGELFEKYIQSVVGGNSKQIPQYFQIPMKDNENYDGEFVFVPQRTN
jgi:hypothetical protein